jgi:hypothetical protein
MPLSIGLRVKPTETKLKMRNRKKASCCDGSAPVSTYRYLLKRKVEELILSNSYEHTNLCITIIFVNLP